MSIEPLAYSVPEALSLLRIGRTTFYEEVRSGRLVIAKVGKKTIVPAHRAREWLKQAEQPAAAA